MTREEKRQFWQQHLTQWQASGQSQSRYCKEQGLKPSTFAYWQSRQTRQRLADQSNADQSPAIFLPGAVKESGAAPPTLDTAVIHCGTLSISLPVEQLAQLLPVLHQLAGRSA